VQPGVPAGREDVSVVIPTIGRVELLRACLDSIAACRPAPAEVVVVDQSGDGQVADLVSGYARLGARVVKSDLRGVAAGRNLGLRAVAHDAVLMTDDDCTVAPDWIEIGARVLAEDPQLIVSGRVLPGGGDEDGVPSTISDTERREHTGTLQCGVLYTNNVAVNRSEVLKSGGFDETFERASDNDLCYRWLTSGRRLVYEPALVVSHHDWRSPKQLKRLYVRYWRGEGALYAKHLRAGDLRILRLAPRDVYWRLRGPLGQPGGRRQATLELRGIVLGLLVGFARQLLGRSSTRMSAGGDPG